MAVGETILNDVTAYWARLQTSLAKTHEQLLQRAKVAADRERVCCEQACHVLALRRLSWRSRFRHVQEKAAGFKIMRPLVEEAIAHDMFDHLRHTRLKSLNLYGRGARHDEPCVSVKDDVHELHEGPIETLDLFTVGLCAARIGRRYFVEVDNQVPWMRNIACVLLQLPAE